MPESTRAALLALAILATPAAPAEAQVAGLDTASLADGPWGRMETLLERTIFQVNVLDLTVRLGPGDAARIRRVARARPRSRSGEDSIARIAARSTNAFARIEFRRTLGLDRFVKGVRSNLRKAVADGYLAAEDAREIGAALPRWFSVLEERKIHDGDRLLYRIRGDTLRTVFVSADGEVLLDQTDVGAERRLAVLGSYFAEGSDFRDGLLRSLLERVSATRGGRPSGLASGPASAPAAGSGAPRGAAAPAFGSAGARP